MLFTFDEGVPGLFSGCTHLNGFVVRNDYMDLDKRFEKRTFLKFVPNCIITTVNDTLHLRDETNLFSFLFRSTFIEDSKKKSIEVNKDCKYLSFKGRPLSSTEFEFSKPNMSIPSHILNTPTCL